MFELIKDEKIIITKRRHHVVFVLQAIAIAFMAFLLIVFAFLNFFIDFAFLQEWLYEIFGGNISDIMTHFLVSFFSISLAAFLWYIILIQFIFFYFDSWIITNKRIIKIIIVSLFSRKLHTTSLRNIQNIRTSRIGVLANIYKFGNLEIETAGNYENFVIRDISQPEELKRIIFAAAEEDRQSVTNN